MAEKRKKERCNDRSKTEWPSRPAQLPDDHDNIAKIHHESTDHHISSVPMMQ